MRFFNFYVAYMVQKYQNESAPIFYYGKSPKTNRKHLKIPYLQALTLGHVIKMTLYFTTLLTSLAANVLEQTYFLLKGAKFLKSPNKLLLGSLDNEC